MFYFTHWEKYNTGILYLPWGYDLSQLVAGGWLDRRGKGEGEGEGGKCWVNGRGERGKGGWLNGEEEGGWLNGGGEGVRLRGEEWNG